MKTKIYILLIVLTTLMSCNTENKQNEEERNHEHGEEGVVQLNTKQQEALDLKIGTFKMRNLTTVVKVNGQLEVAPESRAGVTAIIGGNVKSIKVFQGDKVSKGQVLAILEHPDYITMQEEFATTANNLDFLKQEYDRQKELFDNNVGAGKDFQKAKSDYNNSKVKYESLKSRLLLLDLSPEQIKQGHISNTINIIAPIAGYINSVNVMVGIYVDSKTKMFEIADNSSIHADFMVYEKDVNFLEIGQKIHFTISNKTEAEYSATIFAIGKQFDKDTRAVHIHANIIEDNSGLIPGMYITGHLHTDGEYVKTLPNDAIVNEGTKNYIFIVDNDEHEEHSEHNHKDENKHNHDLEKAEHNHEGHNHKSEEHLEHNEKHEHSNIEENDIIRLKMVEVIVGSSDAGYTEVRLLEELPKNTKVAINSAYYLLSDLNKEETEHEH